MPRLSVAEAAERLGVSKRRILARIQSGSLHAERIGNQWSIDPADLAPGKASRPMSPAMSWALLTYLSGDNPQVSPSERQRLRQRSKSLSASDDPAALLRSWLCRRAERVLLHAAPDDLDDLRGDERLRVSGVSAAGSGIVAGAVVEGYVSGRDYNGLVSEFFLVEPADRRGNVVLHVLRQDPADPRPLDLDAALALEHSWAVVAADLADHDAPRENERVKELISLALEQGSPRGQI